MAVQDFSHKQPLLAATTYTENLTGSNTMKIDLQQPV